MKSLIIAGTILFVAFSAFGIATFIKTKKNHSLDNLYQPNKELEQKIVSKNKPEIPKEEIVESKENFALKQNKKKSSPQNEKIIHAKKPKPDIEMEDFSRAAPDFVEPVTPQTIEDKNN